MLEEHEWEIVKGLEDEIYSEMKYDGRKSPILHQKYKKVFHDILGKFDTNISSQCSIYHHARPLYGTQCKNCGKPLKGPRAIICFECGWKKK